MKKLVPILCLAALTTGALAQGTINFLNASGPLVRIWGSPYPPPPLPAASFYFALLTAPLGTTDSSQFTFAVYGTNLAAAGILRGASSVPGWVPGTSRSFEVVGWDAASGQATFNPAWIVTGPNGVEAQMASGLHYFGVSVIGSGFAGGIDPVTGGPIPPLNIFGGNGIPTSSAFILYPVPWPEPGTAALAALGTAVLLIFRRRK